MKRINLVLIFLGMFSNFLFSQTEITSDEVYKHIEFLASDSLKGRLPGTPEMNVAANYILNDFEKSGLNMMCDNGFQYFEIQMGKKVEHTSLKINNFKCKYVEEYQPLIFSPSSEIKAKVVFVGWGFNVKTDKYSWNDYESVDVKGKWVVVFRGKPNLKDYPSSLFDAGSKEYEKVLEAKDQGAVGVIFINSLQNNPNDELVKSCMGRVILTAAIPAYSVKRFTINRILKASKTDVQSLENIILTSQKPNSFNLNVDISSKLDNEVVNVGTQNIVGYLEGNDPVLKNEYIVIGAHYDHLGFGGCESGSRMPEMNAIHNGADDNASGVAGVLELAEYLSAHKDLLKRSVIFVAFSAEERGLLGSKYFVDNLPVPKENIYAMLNMDMIGKSTGELDIFGTGSAEEFGDILNQIEFDTINFKVKQVAKAQSGSDHASFYNANIPVLFFVSSSFKGYHTPFDDIDEINFVAEANILEYISSIAIKLANYQGSLTYVKSETENGSGKSYGTNVKLGIIPSFEESTEAGFKISGVVGDSPAENAGMQANDRIIKINDEIVNNVYDYMARMKKVNPGDIISIELVRGKETIKLNIQL